MADLSSVIEIIDQRLTSLDSEKLSSLFISASSPAALAASLQENFKDRSGLILSQHQCVPAPGGGGVFSFSDDYNQMPR